MLICKGREGRCKQGHHQAKAGEKKPISKYGGKRERACLGYNGLQEGGGGAIFGGASSICHYTITSPPPHKQQVCLCTKLFDHGICRYALLCVRAHTKSYTIIIIKFAYTVLVALLGIAKHAASIRNAKEMLVHQLSLCFSIFVDKSFFRVSSCFLLSSPLFPQVCKGELHCFCKKDAFAVWQETGDGVVVVEGAIECHPPRAIPSIHPSGGRFTTLAAARKASFGGRKRGRIFCMQNLVCKIVGKKHIDA